MTAITLTQAGVFNGQIHNAGDTVDVSDGDAAWIVSAGRAVLATSAAVTAATIAADTAAVAAAQAQLTADQSTFNATQDALTNYPNF